MNNLSLEEEEKENLKDPLFILKGDFFKKVKSFSLGKNFSGVLMRLAKDVISVDC
jgi:hypothetical protein